LLKRKIDSCDNNIRMQRDQYKQECKSFGIKGDNIRLEIPRLMEQLP
jgi:hypothetical protein